MSCPGTYVALPCAMSGVGYTPTQLTLGSQIALQQGHSANFPDASPNSFYFAHILDACDTACALVRVIGVNRARDTLTVQPISGAGQCFASNSRVRYDNTSVDAIRQIAAEAAPTFASPLVYDCATHTVSLDMGALTNLLNSPCGG